MVFPAIFLAALVAAADDTGESVAAKSVMARLRERAMRQAASGKHGAGGDLSDALAGKGTLPAPTTPPTPAPTPVDYRNLMFAVYDAIQDDFDGHSSQLKMRQSQKAMQYQQHVEKMQLAVQAEMLEVKDIDSALDRTSQKLKGLEQHIKSESDHMRSLIEKAQGRAHKDQDEGTELLLSAMKAMTPFLRSIDATKKELTDEQNRQYSALKGIKKTFDADLYAMDRRNYKQEQRAFKKFTKDEKTEEDRQHRKLLSMSKDLLTSAVQSNEQLTKLRNNFDTYKSDIETSKEKLDTRLNEVLGEDGGEEADSADKYAARSLETSTEEYKDAFDSKKSELNKLWEDAHKQLVAKMRDFNTDRERSEDKIATAEGREWKKLKDVYQEGERVEEKAKKLATDAQEDESGLQTTLNTVTSGFEQNLDTEYTKLVQEVVSPDHGGNTDSFSDTVAKAQEEAKKMWDSSTHGIQLLADQTIGEQVNKLKPEDPQRYWDVGGEAVDPRVKQDFERELKALSNGLDDSGKSTLEPKWERQIEDAQAEVNEWRADRENFNISIKDLNGEVSQIKTKGENYRDAAIRELEDAEKGRKEDDEAAWSTVDNRIEQYANDKTGLEATLGEVAKGISKRIGEAAEEAIAPSGPLLSHYTEQSTAMNNQRDAVWALANETNLKKEDLFAKKQLLNKDISRADLVEKNRFETSARVATAKVEGAIDNTMQEIEDGAQKVIMNGAQEATTETNKVQRAVMETSSDTIAAMRHESQTVKAKIDESAEKVHAVQSKLLLTDFPQQAQKVEDTLEQSRNLYNKISSTKSAYTKALQGQASDSALELMKLLPSQPAYERLLKTHEDEQGERLENSRKEAEDKISEMIDEFSRSTVGMYEKAADKLYGDQGHVSDKAKETRKEMLRAYDEFLTKVHVLAARIKGFSANQDEWNQNLQDTIKEAAAEASAEMMAATSSAVEAQAMIDAKYRAIQDVVNQDVKGVKGPIQSMNKAFVERAKKETMKIMQNAHLSAEEKEERLKMVDQWMSDQLNNAEDLAHKMDGELLNAEEEMRIFDAEAQKRMSGLTEMLSQNDGAEAMATDAQQLEGTALQLGQLAKHSEQEVKQMQEEVVDRVTSEESKHVGAAGQVQKQLEADRGLLEQILGDARQEAEESLSDANATLTHHSDMVEQAKAKVVGIQAEAAGLEHTAQTRVDAIHKDVQDILGKASTERQRIEREVAGMMRTLMLFMMQPLLTSKAFFDHQARQHAQFAGRYEEMMQGDGMKLLHAVGRADTDLDRALTNSKDALEWGHDWDATSDEWEAQVVEGLVKIAEKQGKDVDSLASSVSGFQAEADASAKSAADKAAEEIAKTVQAEDDAQAAADAAEKAAMDQLESAQGATAGAADAEVNRAKAEQEGHAAHEALATQQLQAEAADLLGQMKAAGQKAAHAAAAEETLTEQAQEQAAEAKAQMQNKLDSLRGGVSQMGSNFMSGLAAAAKHAQAAQAQEGDAGSLLERSARSLVAEAEGLTQQVQRVNEGLKAGRSGHDEVERVSEAVLAEHDRLAQQHSLLQSKISTLEKAAKRLLG